MHSFSGQQRQRPDPLLLSSRLLIRLLSSHLYNLRIACDLSARSAALPAAAHMHRPSNEHRNSSDVLHAAWFHRTLGQMRC